MRDGHGDDQRRDSDGATHDTHTTDSSDDSESDVRTATRTWTVPGHRRIRVAVVNLGQRGLTYRTQVLMG